MTPVWLSLSVGLAATALDLAPAIAIAWVLERTRLPLRGALETLVLLPLVLPPVVTGYLLLRLFSPRGGLGRALAALGAPVAFHWLGAVLAAAVMGFPFFVLAIALAIRAVDPRLETASRALGRGAWSTFWRVTLPLASPGILSGAVLAFARGLSEFGATIVLAGEIPGETETIPLAIYAALGRPGGERAIAGLVAISVALGLASVVAARALDRRWRRRLDA